MKLCLRGSRGLGLFLVMVLPAWAQQSVTFPNFCSTTGLTINGSAASLNPNTACVLRLTNQLSQGGSAFLTNTFSLAADASFSTFFRFQMTNPQGIGDTDGQGADGIVFAVQTVGNNVGGGGLASGTRASARASGSSSTLSTTARSTRTTATTSASISTATWHRPFWCRYRAASTTGASGPPGWTKTA